MARFDQALRHLSMLKKAAQEVTLFGDFLLSSNELSHFWIHLERLWHPAKTPIASLMKIFAINHYALVQRPFTLFSVGQHTRTTEEELHIASILSGVVEDLDNPDIVFGQLIVARDGVTLPHGQPMGEWIGVFAMSVHLDLIVQCVRCLRESDRDVSTLLTAVQRGVSPTDIFRREGIQRVVPMLVCNESTQQVNHILELDVPPYVDYQHLFANPK